MKEKHDDVDFEEIQKRVYSDKVFCYSCFCCFCAPCRYVRRCLVEKSFTPADAQASHHSPTNGLSKALSQALHTFDIYTDLHLAYVLYWVSVSEKRDKGDYKFAFAWILMCFWGPYIILYSSTINSFFLKGHFTQSNWKNMGCFRRLYVFFLMTFLGLVFHGLLLDFTIKIQAIVVLISVLSGFSFCKTKMGNTWFLNVSKGCETYVKDIFGMNFFEV